MIELNELLRIVDAKAVRVRAPLTQRLTALVDVDMRQAAEVEDLVNLYGEYAVRSAVPVPATGAMMIELMRE